VAAKKETCAAGCVFTPAKYTGSATFDIPAVVKVDAVAGTETACSTSAHVAAYKSCTSTPSCKGTATKKAVQEGGSDGKQVVPCAVAPTGKKEDCPAGCTFTAHVPGEYTGTSTKNAKEAVVAVAAYTPMCSLLCSNPLWGKNPMKDQINSYGCPPGCNDGSPKAEPEPVAPAPEDLADSALAPTIAAAAFALSAFAAIVAL